MSLDLVTYWSFAMSFLLPVLAFMAGSAAGIPSLRLARVMFGFWIPSLVSSGLALVVMRHAEEPLVKDVLFTNAAAYLALTLPKVAAILFGRPPREKDRPQITDAAAADAPCTPTIINETHGATKVPYTRTITSGGLGWFFLVANYYEGTLYLDIGATSHSVSGVAIADGAVSPWYSLRWTHRIARAQASGSVSCERVDGVCVADATGSQDHDTDVEFTAAAVVTGTATGGKATLQVDVAAALAGQVALSGISSGVSGGGIQIGGTLNIPNSAIGGKKASKSYTYRCSSV